MGKKNQPLFSRTNPEWETKGAIKSWQFSAPSEVEKNHFSAEKIFHFKHPVIIFVTQIINCLRCCQFFFGNRLCRCRLLGYTYKKQIKLKTFIPDTRPSGSQEGQRRNAPRQGKLKDFSNGRILSGPAMTTVWTLWSLESVPAMTTVCCWPHCVKLCTWHPHCHSFCKQRSVLCGRNHQHRPT